MSSTIKQAIEALKSRVADAYTAIVAKGGTLPATQDSANLPSAIASIPSGGAFDMTGVTLQPGVSSMAKILMSQGVKKYDDTGFHYITYALTGVNNIEEIIAPYGYAATNNNQGNAWSFCYGLKRLTLGVSATTCGSSTNFCYSGFEELYLPYLTFAANYPFCRGNNNLRIVECPQIKTAGVQMFSLNPLLERVLLGTLTSITTNQFLQDCPKLIDVEIGAGTSIYLPFDRWVPDNTILLDATKVAELNKNIRDHIAAKVSGSNVVGFKSGIYNVLEQETIDAFTNVGWSVTNLG